MVRLQQGDTEVDYGKANAANRVRRKWTSVEVRPLDEQIGERTRRTKLPQLWPEPPLRHGSVQIEDALPFYNRVFADGIVASGERGNLDLRAKLLEEGGNPARALVNVDNDPRRASSH
jgi:hypothetical protein